MVERFAAALRRFDGDDDVFFDARLPDEVGHALGADAGVGARVFVKGAAGYDPVLRGLLRTLLHGLVWSAHVSSGLLPAPPQEYAVILRSPRRPKNLSAGADGTDGQRRPKTAKDGKKRHVTRRPSRLSAPRPSEECSTVAAWRAAPPRNFRRGRPWHPPRPPLFRRRAGRSPD